MADALNSAKEVVSGAADVANDVLRVRSAVAKTSVTRLTRDQVFQFPIFLDADIDDDEKYPIIKSVERNYAQLCMIAISNNGEIDRDRYGDVNEFLRKFHNNSAIPAAFESVTVSASACEGWLPSDELASMWDTLESMLDMGNINDMYRPFRRTSAKLSRAVEASADAKDTKKSAPPAAPDEKFFRATKIELTDSYDANGKKHEGRPQVVFDKSGNPKYNYMPASSANAERYRKQFGEARTMREWKQFDAENSVERQLNKLEDEEEYQRSRRDKEADLQKSQRLSAASSTKGSVIKEDSKYSNMAPTVVNLQLANIKKGVGAWSQQLIIGVKAMPRFIPQSVLVNDMIGAAKNQLIFKYIKWTNGEIKFSDIFCGLSSARSDAKGQSRWLSVLRKRARLSKIPFVKLNPNTTVIITENDAHIIYERCGVNLLDPMNVRKLMDKYFLLGFGIYDTEGKMLKILYDGESEFTFESLRSMMADAKKNTDQLSLSRY